MAKSRTEIEVVAKGKGVKMVQKDVKDMASSINDADKAQRRSNKTGNETYRNLQGVAGNSANVTKNFSKMSQGITGGLVPAYAALAANVFAITAAFNFFKSIGDLRSLQQSQVAYAQRTGQSLSLLTKEVQAATDGMLKFEEAAQAIAIGRSAGLTGGQIKELAAVAKNASLALGRDLTDSFNRLTRGAIKAEPELLDELGIIVRLDKATKDYADKVGKTAAELTTWEKSQAVLNAVITQGEEKFKDLNVEVNGFVQLGRAFDDLLNSIKTKLEPLASFLADSLSKNVVALSGAFALLGANILKTFVKPRAITQYDDAMKGLTKNLQQGLNPQNKSKTVQNIMSGEFSKADLDRLKKNMNRLNGTMVRNNDIWRRDTKNTLKLMSLYNDVYIAEAETGFKGMFQRISAEWRLTANRYGAVLGQMVAGAQLAGRAIGAALSFIGYIGAAITLFGIIKQAVDYFKSDAVKAAEEAGNRIKQAFKDQVKEIRPLISTLRETNNVLDNMVQMSNLLGNFTFGTNLDAVEAQLNSIEKLGVRGPTYDAYTGAQITDEMVIATREEIAGFQAAADAAAVFTEAAAKSAIKTGTLEQSTSSLTNAMNEFAKSQSPENFQALQEAFAAFRVDQEAVSGVLTDQITNFERLKGAAEAYGNVQKELESRKTPFATAVEAIQDMSESLEVVKQSIEDGVYSSDQFRNTFGDNAEYIRRILGDAFVPGVEGRYAAEAIEANIQALQAKGNIIKEKELAIATRANVLARKKYDLERDSGSYSASTLAIEQERLDIASQINDINAQRSLRLINNTKLSPEEAANEDLTYQLLWDRLRVIKSINTEKVKELEIAKATVSAERMLSDFIFDRSKANYTTGEAKIRQEILGYERQIKDIRAEQELRTEAERVALADTIAGENARADNLQIMVDLLKNINLEKLREAEISKALLAVERERQDFYFQRNQGNFTTSSLAVERERLDITRKIEDIERDIASRTGEEHAEANAAEQKRLDILREMLGIIDNINTSRLEELDKAKIIRDAELELAKIKSSGATSRQAAIIQRELEIRSINNEILDIRAQQESRTEQQREVLKDTVLQENLRLQILEAQSEELRRQGDYAVQIADTINQAFEDGLQSGLEDLLTGKESSLRDTVLKIAQTVLTSLASTWARQITEFITQDSMEQRITNAHGEGARLVEEAINRAFVNNCAREGMTSPISIPGGTYDEYSDSFISQDTTTPEGTVASITQPGGPLKEFVTSITEVFNTESPFLGRLFEIFRSAGSKFTSVFQTIISLFTGTLKSSQAASAATTAVTLEGAHVAGLTAGALAAGLKIQTDMMIAGNIAGQIIYTYMVAAAAASIGGGPAPARNGGIMSNGKMMSGYAYGGIASGSTSGYPAMLHGTEAVVPLPNGRSIPVEMSGSSQQNNVTVNVSMDNQGNATETVTEDGAGNLGKAISLAVQRELQKQKRSGGILSPYGVA